MLPTLYKRTARGQLQSWRIDVAGDSYTTTEGLVDGAQTTTKPTYCQGKNLGRANATTSAQQAEKDARAKWQKKVDAGYVDSPDEVDAAAKFIAPMLAPTKVYTPDDYTLEFPVWSQPKLDGVRCIAKRDGLWSRRGKQFTSCRHIESALAPVFVRFPDLILDGELYNHDLHDDFNQIISYVRTAKPTDAERAACEAVVQYHIYDCPSAQGTSLERLAKAWQALPSHPALVQVVTHIVRDHDALDACYDDYLNQGYEGQMIRRPGPYEFGRRSKLLLKRKSFIDQELEIAGVVEGTGNRAGMMGTIVFRFTDGRLFEGGALGDHTLYRDLWENQSRYVGQRATVRYQNLTPAGVPRCARMIALRDYE